MNKLLLALIALSAGAGAVHIARQSTTRLEQEAKVLRDDWLAHSQTVASAQADLAGANERIREINQSLRQSPPVTDNRLWSALQTNRADRLPTELRERLREELGFNWQFSPDYIVVSKQTVRDIGMQAITRDGKLTDVAATVLAVTPEERGQVGAAIERVKMDFKEWALAHVERSEPKDEVVAQYTLPNDQAMLQGISNNFAAGLFDALGLERAEVILPSARYWMNIEMGLGGSQPARIIIWRDLVRNEPRLKVEIWEPGGGPNSGYLPQPQNNFPRPLLAIFPNGWADVAKREGFELPEESQKK
jgi:hypothetical protein